MFEKAANKTYLDALRNKLQTTIKSAQENGFSKIFIHDRIPLIVQQELIDAGYTLIPKKEHSMEIEWVEATNDEFPPKEPLVHTVNTVLKHTCIFPSGYYTEEEAEKIGVLECFYQSLKALDIPIEDAVEYLNPEQTFDQHCVIMESPKQGDSRHAGTTISTGSCASSSDAFEWKHTTKTF